MTTENGAADTHATTGAGTNRKTADVRPQGFGHAPLGVERLTAVVGGGSAPARSTPRPSPTELAAMVEALRANLAIRLSGDTTLGRPPDELDPLGRGANEDAGEDTGEDTEDSADALFDRLFFGLDERPIRLEAGMQGSKLAMTTPPRMLDERPADTQLADTQLADRHLGGKELAARACASSTAPMLLVFPDLAMYGPEAAVVRQTMAIANWAGPIFVLLGRETPDPRTPVQQDSLSALDDGVAEGRVFAFRTSHVRADVRATLRMLLNHSVFRAGLAHGPVSVCGGWRDRHVAHVHATLEAAGIAANISALAIDSGELAAALGSVAG